MVWTPPRRVVFRFGFLFAALLLFPFPLQVIPEADWLVDLVRKPFDGLVIWCATDVLGLDEPSLRPTGSGDTTASYVQHLVFFVLAVAGTAVWSVLDRRRTAYPRLAAGARVVLRYYLAFMLLDYGIGKLAQFPPPFPQRLDQRVGDMSPMGMLWTFMGSSKPYALFTGCAEVLGGALLLWRRTHVAGALVVIAVMSNVVMLNFCYDVPVKLFSTQLLVIALVLVAPHARRLIAAVLGRATPEVPPRPRRSPRLERARLAAKLLFLAMLAIAFSLEVKQSLGFVPPEHELHGIWVVDRFVLDGSERPPLLTDAERWHKVYFWQLGAGIRPMDGPIVRLAAKVDPAQHTVGVQVREMRPRPGGPRPAPPGQDEVWQYALSTVGDPATLVLDGTLRGKKIHAELHREPDALLVTRGFRWINEVPFNR